MKKIISTFLVLLMCFGPCCSAIAIQEATVTANQKGIQYNPNARTMKYAFVFDGPSDKNNEVLRQFQSSITKSTAPDYKAEFPANLVFTGDWTQAGAKAASDRALASNAISVVSLGYLSSKYYNNMGSKNKFVVTIDQYGLRDFGDNFFNPIQQSVKGVGLFKKLTNFNKTAILMNENYYKTRNDWHSFIEKKLQNVNFAVIPATNDVDATLSSIPKDCDAVVLTPLFNLSLTERRDLISKLNAKKIPTYSTLGKEDVELGVLMGSGAYDLDRKIAETTSFNIKSALQGEVKKSERLNFVEDEVLYLNKDTAEDIGYAPHLRFFHNAEIISANNGRTYDLSTVFNMLETQNLNIKRKEALVKAARRSTASAALKYLPSFGITLGYNQFNWDYAESAKMLQPEKYGVFQMGIEQVIYSPALVTNILIKRKQSQFAKAEQKLTEQNMGINIALTYIDMLMLEKAIGSQKEYITESRELLAMARVREKMGICGPEEALRWSSKLRSDEQKLMDMESEYRNIKISMNYVLANKLSDDFQLTPLTANDPAFYTKDIHVIDYVLYPGALEKFTQMLVDEAYRVAPELVKLKAAMKMKDYERNMYYQKFILPDAKATYTYTSLFNRDFTSPMMLPGIGALGHSNVTSGQLGVYAQWRPFEGGSKIAEIMRIEAEKQELKYYEQDVRANMEAHVRETINRALAGYLSIEKDYKAMYASQENYKLVKTMYLKGKAPISQVVDAQHLYLDSKLAAANSQNKFFKELLWVQRAICSVNWATAPKEAKDFIQKIKDNLEEGHDITL